MGLKQFSDSCNEFMENFFPDAFNFALIMTVGVFLAAMWVAGATPLQMTEAWSRGVWGLLAFSMQMALGVVLGTAFSSAPAVKNALARLAKLAKTPRQGIMLAVLVGLATSFINWCLGLIVGAFFGRALARHVKGIDYRLAVAAGYSGFAVWHAGLSGAIPLALGTADNLHPDKGMANTGGSLTNLIGTGETIFAPWNLIMVAVYAILMVFLLGKAHPDAQNVFIADPEILEDEERIYPKPSTPAERIESSPLLAWVIGLIGVTHLVQVFASSGLSGVDLNTMNFLFLAIGLPLHGSPIRYWHAVLDAAKGAAGVILQFPFYAGIQAMMIYSGGTTGVSLAGLMSNFFASISSAATYPLFSFLSAGILNVFIPSGGGQWVLQGPIMMPTGAELGVKPAVTAMAIAWGDQWTNMIQPFWALPALGIARLSASDIMGYCMLPLLVMGVVACVGFLLLGFWGAPVV